MTDWPMYQPTRRAFLAQSAAALALARTSFAAPAARVNPQPIPFGSITAGGDLAHRTAQNFSRLQADIYRPPLVWRQTNWKSWPGDFEGRALLAVTLLAQATGSEPDYFPAMVAAYPAQLNDDGYFGPKLDLHAINEQQLSGHGWFLRGLCEYYEWKRDPATLAQISKIVRNLALPLRGKYATYPIDPEMRAQAAAPTNPGAVDGHLSGQHGDWAVSSDTGCAFIFLDGIAHAWVVLNAAHDPSAPALKTLIDEAIARFAQVDLVAIKAQTHASLTATRALLRIYSATGDAALLRAAQDRYHLYRTTAMTEHYANTNWFGRPDSWTEPCAIIDSFMVATQLWQHTGDAAYLEDAHLIWFNGIGRGLRANGGFGTDTCPGFTSPFVKVRSYEAYFCCTMRGGEGHARAAQYLYFTQPGELTVPFFSDSVATVDIGTGPVKLRQTTNYPYGGQVRIEVLSMHAPSPVRLRLFAPVWTLNHRLSVNGQEVQTSLQNGFLTARLTPKPGDVVQLDSDLHVGPREPVNPKAMPGYYAFRAGPLLLGSAPNGPVTTPSVYPEPAHPAADRPATFAELHVRRDAHLEEIQPGMYQVPGGYLRRINDLNDSYADRKDPCPRQILFRA